MRLPRINYIVCLAASCLLWGTQAASGSLITNGSFDSDLSDWSKSTTLVNSVGVEWISGTAHIGRPGTPGETQFWQSFDIAAGTSGLEISFEYQWQSVRPTNPDNFLVQLVYATTSGPQTVTLINQSSAAVPFLSTITFSQVVPLSDLVVAPDNGTLRFTLTEVNNTVGTRIQLDNVSVAAVPEPCAWAVWSLLGVCMLVASHRRPKR